MADFTTKTIKRKNAKGLTLNPSIGKAAPSAGDAQIPGSLGYRDDRRDTLEIGVEFRLDLRAEDLIFIKELGAGNGGTVSKVQHAATKNIMARKIIHVEAKKEVRKRIVRELQIMYECRSPNIVSFYGAFMNDAGDVIMCMEYMDVGSLDYISKNFGPIRVDVLGKIAEAVLAGLTYIWRAHRIMHRDIKPSNVLVNSSGNIKLCDFGVSSELEGSVAETFVGTGTYMAPERIQGLAYTVKSDVWSVGLTLMELAIGKFPFNSGGDGEDDEPGGPQGILDLLQTIVMEDSPRLPKSDAFPQILEDMIAQCLMKDPKDRPTPQELYDHDPFLQAAKRTPVNLEEWAVSMMERHNRKSHLAPQLSPSTRALLRGSDDTHPRLPGSAQSTENNRTPTWQQAEHSVDVDALPLEMEGLAIDPRRANGYASSRGEMSYDQNPSSASSRRTPQPYDSQYKSRDGGVYPQHGSNPARSSYNRSLNNQNVPVHPAYREDIGSRTPQSSGWSTNGGRERRVGFEG